MRLTTLPGNCVQDLAEINIRVCLNFWRHTGIPPKIANSMGTMEIDLINEWLWWHPILRPPADSHHLYLSSKSAWNAPRVAERASNQGGRPGYL